jgi:hypothetical protein
MAPSEITRRANARELANMAKKVKLTKSPIWKPKRELDMAE